MEKPECYGWGCAKMLTAFLSYPSLAVIFHFHALVSRFPLLQLFEDLFLETLLVPVIQIICTIY
jgi:hypothetical protein